MLVDSIDAQCNSLQFRTGELKRVSLEENAARNRKLGLLVRASDYAQNSARFLYNCSVGLMTGQSKKYAWTEVPLNLGEIIMLVNEVGRALRLFELPMIFVACCCAGAFVRNFYERRVQWRPASRQHFVV